MFERVSCRSPWLVIITALWVCAPPPDAGSSRASFASLAPVTDARLPEARTSILVYHRFGAVVADSMTIRTRTFRWQLEYLRDHGYQVIPLGAWIAWRLRLGPPPPARSVVITADFLAIDIFGYVCWNPDDTKIGQQLERVAEVVDSISPPMLYPSSFQFGIPGYRNPVQHSYEIVHRSLARALERTRLPRCASARDCRPSRTTPSEAGHSPAERSGHR